MGKRTKRNPTRNRLVSFGIVCGVTAVLGVIAFATRDQSKVSLNQNQTLGLAVTKSAENSEKSIYVTYTATPTPTVAKNSGVTVATVTSMPTSIPTSVTTSTPKPTATTTSTPKPTTTVTVTATPTQTPTFDYSKPWTVAPNCPASTLNCVPCKAGETYCRLEPGKTRGFKGWSCQNNNPGNIRNASTNMATDTKNLMIVRNGGTAACGVRYDSRDGGSYFVFSTYNTGYNSLKAYIKGINNGEHTSYKGSSWTCSGTTYTGNWSCGNCTLEQFFSKYAPYSCKTYAATVAKEMGIPVTQTIKYIIDAGKLDAFAIAIKNYEGFYTQ